MNADQPAPTETSSSSRFTAPAGTAPSVLTARQSQIYNMARPIPEGGRGMKNKDIAAELGISVPVVNKTLVICYRKLGLKKSPGKRAAAEYNDPEKFAAVIDAATEPEAKLESIRKVFKDYGLPPIASDRLLRRIRHKYFGVVEATRSLKSAEIVDALNHKIDLALRYMDDKTMSEASFRDLALGTTAMIEKRQLLRGEPTAIISDHERKKLHELLPAFIDEAKRRGITVEGQVTGRSVEPR